MAKKWSKKEYELLEKLFLQGHTLKEISTIINRPYGSVKEHAQKIELSKKYPRKNYIDLKGKIIGNLKVLEKADKRIKPSGQTVTIWKCQCLCEKRTIVYKSYESLVKYKIPPSCGCIKKEKKDFSNKIGLENVSNEGCVMRIKEYLNYDNITIEFIDYHVEIKTRWRHFMIGDIHNPYLTVVFGVGYIGTKYSPCLYKKEYKAWQNMLRRCYYDKENSYKNVYCCYEWHNFENFCEWLINQSNYNQWLNDDFAVDKDILSDYNAKYYSPSNCCLVKKYINNFFVFMRNDVDHLIGVTKNGNIYYSNITNPLNGEKYKHICSSEKEANNLLLKDKNEIINIIAEHEYKNKNITKEYYLGMKNYISKNKKSILTNLNKLKHEFEERGVELV